MSMEMDWSRYVPTQEIIDYSRRFHECIRQREHLKHELSEHETKGRDMFWDLEHAMLSTGIRYFDTCADYWMHRLEYEYVMAEKNLSDEK